MTEHPKYHGWGREALIAALESVEAREARWAERAEKAEAQVKALVEAAREDHEFCEVGPSLREAFRALGIDLDAQEE